MFDGASALPGTKRPQSAKSLYDSLSCVCPTGIPCSPSGGDRHSHVKRQCQIFMYETGTDGVDGSRVWVDGMGDAQNLDPHDSML